MVMVQLGHLDEFRALPPAAVTLEMRANRSGVISSVDAMTVGLAAHATGAGRDVVGQPVDPDGGIRLRVKSGTSVEAGDLLGYVYSSDEDRATRAHQILSGAFEYDGRVFQDDLEHLEVIE